MNTHRFVSVAAGILLLGGLLLFGACFLTGFDGKWVLSVLMVAGFVGLTMWTDPPMPHA